MILNLISNPCAISRLNTISELKGIIVAPKKLDKNKPKYPHSTNDSIN
jgi:hypothetical protein